MMNAVRYKRLFWIIAVLVAVCAVAYAVIQTFNNNMVFFYTPSQFQRNEIPTSQAFRLGGMVEKGSLQREANTLTIHFNVTDTHHTLPVKYTGVLPDLFKEGKGVVAEGRWNGQLFEAREILAKHDENYMPPGVKP